MAESISWPQLVALMAFGPDGRTDETVRGVVHQREVEQVSDGVEVSTATFDHPTLGPMIASESVVHVVRRGDRARISRPDGRPKAIRGADTLWLFGDADVPEAVDLADHSFGGFGPELSRRSPLSRWDGNDFTRLTGPIEATTILGRPAWAFELAPPRHKPYPLQLVVDAHSGLVLRQANRDFGSVAEWTEFEFDVELPDEFFRWDGPARPAPTRAQRMAEGQVPGRGVSDLSG